MAAMGPLDYPHYFFLNMVVETGGGLEHKNSFLTMSNRFVTRTRAVLHQLAEPGRRTSTSTTGT